MANVGTIPAVQPKEIRLAAQMITSTAPFSFLAINIYLAISASICLLLYVRWHVFNPLVQAKSFFLHTHWKPSWISRRRALLLRSKVVTSHKVLRAYVFAGRGGVRGATPTNLGLLPTQSENRPRAYVIYQTSTPGERKTNLEEVWRLRFDSKIDVVPLEMLALRRGLMSKENCDSILSEAEKLYLTLDDPYEDAMPIKDPNFFFGRQTTLETMSTKIADGQHVGIFGLRKTGKTSLALRLLEKFSDVPFIYVSCQGLDSSSSEGVLSKIARDLRSVSKQLDPKAAKSLPHRRNGLRSEIEDVLIWWKSTGRGTACVVVLDEIEELFPVGGGSENRYQLVEGRRAFNILRSLAQEHRTLSLVTIGNRPDINRINSLPWGVGLNPMFMSVSEFFSGFLSQEESAQMLRELGAWKQIEWENDALDFVYRQCGGHPFITRIFASSATQTEQRIDERIVAETAQQTRHSMRNHTIGTWYGETFDSLPDPQKKVLGLVAQSRTPMSENNVPSDLTDALTSLENYNFGA